SRADVRACVRVILVQGPGRVEVSGLRLGCLIVKWAKQNTVTCGVGHGQSAGASQPESATPARSVSLTLQILLFTMHRPCDKESTAWSDSFPRRCSSPRA